MKPTVGRAPVMEMRAGWKAFGAVRALEGVDLSVHRGEIVALLGDNGAGKSTLIKAISGVHRLDEGEILVEGKPAVLRTPAQARSMGIETVYQDLALFPNLSAIENFFIGRELAAPRGLGRLALLRKRAMAAEWNVLAYGLGVHMKDPHQPIALMSGGQRQAVAVAKAVAFATRLVVLDEPTAALGIREARAVLDLIRRLPERGISVLLISHNLEEVMSVADRVVVLRQGRLIGEATPEPAYHQQIVSMIVGAAATGQSTRDQAPVETEQR